MLGATAVDGVTGRPPSGKEEPCPSPTTTAWSTSRPDSSTRTPFRPLLAAGRPTRPREYRRTRAWWVLAVGLGMLVAGIGVPDGLLIAAGLVTSGIGVQLIDPYRRPDEDDARRPSPR
ncbi:hypothetical protein ACFQV4_03485 [Streptomyces thermocarboxydus]